MSDDDFAIQHTEDDFIPKPKWPLPFGIVSIALGGLGLVCGGLGAIFMPFAGKMVSGQLNGAPLPPSMDFGPLDYTLAGVGLALSILLLIAGILLLGRAPLSRWLYLFYSVAAIPLSILNLMQQSAKQAATVQWAADYPDNQMAQAIANGGPAQEAGQLVGMAFVVLLGIVFPLFVFLWFMLVKPKAEHITGTQTGVY